MLLVFIKYIGRNMMKTIRVATLLALCVAGTLTVSPAHADVGGEAARDVTIIFDGCYRITNHNSNRRVHVVMGPYSFNLQVGETKTLIGFGNQCVTSYMGGDSASYIDPAR